MSSGWCNGCLRISFAETLPLVVTSSTVSPIGVNTACCITRIGATSAGLPRMYVAIGRPMLFEFRYSEFSAPMVASAAFRWKKSRLSIRKTTPTSMAEKNATMMEEWKISKIFSFERIANIRHGLETKKLNRLSTIWAVGPPMRIRAAMYPTAMTMPITQKPSIALNRPGIACSFFASLRYFATSVAPGMLEGPPASQKRGQYVTHVR